MALLTESLVVDLVLGTVTLLGIFYLYITSAYTYWQKRGVPFVKPSFPFGSVSDMIFQRKHLLTVINDIYAALPNEKCVGYFEGMSPALMIRDPEIIQRILIKDFTHFVNRGIPVDMEKDPLTANLLNLEDDVWKNLRNKLTPTFTTGKLKGMIDQMCQCGEEVLEVIEKAISNNEAVDAKKVGSSFSIEVIASCAFGLQFRHNSPEGIQFREVVNSMFCGGRTKYLILIFFFGNIARFFGIKQFSKEVSDYFNDLVRQTVQYRKNNNVRRSDFLQLMINLREQEDTGKEINWKIELSEEDKYLNQLDYGKNSEKQTSKNVMTDECITAQSFVFLLAGSEIVASSVSFILYELACNPDVQKRVQQEVDSVLKQHGSKIKYEALKEMTYLDLVIQERNRKYAEGGPLLRKCSVPYKLPGTDIVVEKGTKLVIPIQALHNDPEYYPEPDKFIPERFEGNNYRSSGTYLPFGDGPRMCIGMRFALLELKACVAVVMSRFSVTLDPKTQVPLKLDPTSVVFTILGGVWLKFHRR